MVGIYCSVEGCWEPNGGTSKKHTFPNPRKNRVIFNIWVELCGNKRLREEHMTPEKIYTNCRVCHKHFDNQDFEGNFRLKRTAFPHIGIPVKTVNTETLASHNVLDPTVYSHANSECGEDGDYLVNTESLASRSVLDPTDYSYANSECGDDEDYTVNTESLASHSVLDPSDYSYANSECSDDEDLSEDQPTTSDISDIRPRRPPSAVLLEIDTSRSGDLISRAKYLYKRAIYFKQRAAAATKSRMSFKRRLEEATKFSQSEAFDRVVSSMDAIRFRLIQSKLENVLKRRHGRRYSLEDEVLALALFKQCGRGYKLLSNIFALPSRTTVMRMLNRIPVEPGLCDAVFDVLAAEVKTFTNPLQKYCTLIFDEMPVKPGLHWNSFNGSVEGFEDFGYRRSNSVATYVQVFMLQGILRTWKQPVFYNFASRDTKHTDIVHIIKLIVRKCSSVGLEVITTICNHRRNNEAAVNYLLNETKREYVKKNQPFSEDFFEVDTNKIVPLFDVPHLMKSLRNNFLKYNAQITIDGKIYLAKWEHIMKAYKIDLHFGSLRSMPKLTDRHVNPSHITKLEISYCTQVLSRTVATAINIMAFSGTEMETEEGPLIMENEATETAKFIEFVDNLFDSVNGYSNITNPLKPLLSPVSDESGHFKFWGEATNILSSLKYIDDYDSTFVSPSVKNFIRTLRHFRKLYDILKEVGFSYILPRRFNQDPIQNFFGRVRRRGAKYNIPTCASFSPFFKCLLVNDLISSHSVGSNCLDDESELFTTLQTLVTQGLAEQSEEEDEQLDVSNIPSAFRTKLQISELKILEYVCGYLIKKAQTSYKRCHCASLILGAPTDNIKESDNFINLNQYRRSKSQYVSNYFWLKMKQGLILIKFCLNKYLHKKGVFPEIYRIVCRNINFTVCEHNEAIKKAVFTYFTKMMGQ